MPRKGRGESDVPIGLRALGVTSREADVLRLVAAGGSDKDVAAELFLSLKTVERHCSMATSRFFSTAVPACCSPLSEAVAKVTVPSTLRWVSFGHVESDECGSINHWLETAPNAQVIFNPLAVMVSVNDLADRPSLPLVTDEAAHDIGGHRLRVIPTPHVPHGWEAQVMFHETTRTLFCGEIYTQVGEAPSSSTTAT